MVDVWGAGTARPVGLGHKNAWLNLGSSVSKLRKDCDVEGIPRSAPGGPYSAPFYSGWRSPVRHTGLYLILDPSLPPPRP